MKKVLIPLCTLATAAFAAGCGDDDPVVPTPTGCAAIFDTCGDNASCAETDGVAACVCDAGYEGDGATCTDVDECAAGTDTCGDDTMCVNTDGGFDCACDEGFLGDGVDCTETDECALGLDDCAENAECTNVPGSWTCACPDGFTGDGTTSCDDVDECTEGTDDCSDVAECVNTVGGFECACPEGTAGDDCGDVDECLSGLDDCFDGDGTTCTNTLGGWECGCGDGWTGDGLSQCEDVDECADGTAGCSDDAACTNTPGAFECVCNEGFGGDGFTCEDIDECESTTVECPEDRHCENTLGGFECVCDFGFVDEPGSEDGCLSGLLAADGRSGRPGNLYLIDPHRLTVQTIGEIGFALTGLAMSPTGELFGTEATWGGRIHQSSLISLDPATGAGTPVGFLFDGEYQHNSMPSATFVGDQLYAWTENGDDLARIDTATGEVTLVGDSGTNSWGSGIGADAEGTIWAAVSGFDSPLRIVSTETGAVSVATEIGVADHDSINSIAWADGVLYAVGSDEDGEGTPHLFSIDSETGDVTSILEIPSGISGLTAVNP